MLKNNLALKLVGLLIAALIWLQIAFQTEQQSVLNLPLELTSAAEGEKPVPSPQKVPFNVSGKGLDILRLRLSKLAVQFTAAQFADPNREVASLEYSLVNRPPTLDVDILGPVPGVTVGSLGKRGLKAPKSPAKNARSSAEKPSQGDRQANRNARQELTTTRILENVKISDHAVTIKKKSTATLKVEGRESDLASLPQGIIVSAGDKPDASGTHQVNVKLPGGIELLDLTPKRVRLLK